MSVSDRLEPVWQELLQSLREGPDGRACAEDEIEARVHTATSEAVEAAHAQVTDMDLNLSLRIAYGDAMGQLESGVGAATEMVVACAADPAEADELCADALEAVSVMYGEAVEDASVMRQLVSGMDAAAPAVHPFLQALVCSAVALPGEGSGESDSDTSEYSDEDEMLGGMDPLTVMVVIVGVFAIVQMTPSVLKNLRTAAGKLVPKRVQNFFAKHTFLKKFYTKVQHGTEAVAETADEGMDAVHRAASVTAGVHKAMSPLAALGQGDALVQAANALAAVGHAPNLDQLARQAVAPMLGGGNAPALAALATQAPGVSLETAGDLNPSVLKLQAKRAEMDARIQIILSAENIMKLGRLARTPEEIAQMVAEDVRVALRYTEHPAPGKHAYDAPSRINIGDIPLRRVPVQQLRFDESPERIQKLPVRQYGHRAGAGPTHHALCLAVGATLVSVLASVVA